MPPQPHVPHSHQTPPQHHTRGSDPDFGGSRAHSKVRGPKEWRSLVPHFETSNLTTLVSRIQGRVQFCFRICRTSRKRQQCTAAGHGHWPCPARRLYASSTCDGNCRGGGAQQTFLKRNTQLKKTAQAGQWGTQTHTHGVYTHTQKHTHGVYTHTHSVSPAPPVDPPWARLPAQGPLPPPQAAPGAPSAPRAPPAFLSLSQQSPRTGSGFARSGR